MKTLQLLFGLKERVTRAQYLFWGVTLMILKYAGELSFYYVATGQILTPANFLWPTLAGRYPGYKTLSDGFIPTVVLWSLPFIWIGVGMSIRRAADAALSPWLGVLFFLPVINFLLMFRLALAPSSPRDSWGPQHFKEDSNKLMYSLALSIVFALLGVTLSWFSTNFLKVYTASLFMGGPLILGLVQGYLLIAKGRQSWSFTLGYITVTILVVHLFLLLFALEGVICLAMSLPISEALGIFGGILGAAIADYNKPESTSPSLLLLILPLMPIAEKSVVTPHQDTVLSTIEIDASPSHVWTHVVQFSTLPPPKDWLFQLGVAYPVRAQIDGHGVGAVRRCEFSTGAFVEPITAWEEPTRLAFDVQYQPQPMKELSFYDQVDAPHLNGYFRSIRGEFRLIPIGGEKTRLEGRTWYEVDMQPGWYWQFYGRWFIHKIHLRVLGHIKNLTENNLSSS